MRPATSAKTPPKPHSSEAAPSPAWASEIGWEADVILSTRVRLARNLAGTAFPGRAADAELKAVARQVLAVAKRRDKGHVSLRAVEIAKLSEAEKAALVDSHLISIPHAQSGPHRLEQRVSLSPARLDQRDGPGQLGPGAREHPVGEGVHVDGRLTPTTAT